MFKTPVHPSNLRVARRRTLPEPVHLPRLSVVATHRHVERLLGLERASATEHEERGSRTRERCQATPGVRRPEPAPLRPTPSNSGVPDTMRASLIRGGHGKPAFGLRSGAAGEGSWLLARGVGRGRVVGKPLGKNPGRQSTRNCPCRPRCPPPTPWVCTLTPTSVRPARRPRGAPPAKRSPTRAPTVHPTRCRSTYATFADPLYPRHCRQCTRACASNPNPPRQGWPSSPAPSSPSGRKPAQCYCSSSTVQQRVNPCNSL